MNKFLLLFLILFPLNIYSQPCGLQQPLPTDPAVLESVNNAIATCYAPAIRQLATINDQSGDNYVNGLVGRGDLITGVRYDGNDDAGDNWDSLQNFIDDPTIDYDELDPIVYYSVVWTNSHWVITYAIYHPRDYAHTTFGCCLDNHENDLEGAILVVSRSTELVEGVYTISHFDLIHYNDEVSVPILSVDNATHAVEANIGVGCIKTPVNLCDQCDLFLPGTFILYTLSSNGVASVDATPSGDFLTGTGSYILEDIYGSHLNSLNNLKTKAGATMFNGNDFAHSGFENCQSNGAASAPWGWGQFDYYTDEIEKIINLAGSNNGFPWRNIPAPNTQFERSVIVYNNPYYNHCFTRAANISIFEDFTWDISDEASFKKIVVEDGITLTIKDHTINFIDDGELILKPGSTLILDNAILRGCASYKWKGINTPEPSASTIITIDISNNSEIRNAEKGISNKYYTPPGAPESGSDLNLHVRSSVFEDNDTPIEIMGAINHDQDYILENVDFVANRKPVSILGHQTGFGLVVNCDFIDNELEGLEFKDGNVQTSVINSNFIDNTIGIYMENSSKLSISRCEFTSDYVGMDFLTNATGIKSFESFSEVSDGNKFYDIHKGISVEGTFPTSSGMMIGNIDYPSNKFNNNNTAIYAPGNDNPAGLRITNNVFNELPTQNSSRAVNFHGYNSTKFGNNTVSNTDIGIIMDGTGSNENELICNEFQNTLHGDNLILNNNSQTYLVENNFQSPNVSQANVNIIQAIIGETQEFNDLPMANCFTDNKPEISGTTTEKFNYHYSIHSSAEPCEVPSPLPDEFDLTPENVLGDHCPDGTGIINIPPSTSGYLTPFVLDPPTLEPDSLIGGCPSCIRDSINAWVNIVINNGGDNPYTPIEETAPNISINGNAELEDWINYGLYIALEDQDYSFAEQILLPFGKWKWKVRLYGIYLVSGQYTKARNLINSLPSRNPNEIYFKDIADINIKRHEAINVKYIPSASEELKLIEVAMSDEPTSGYAASLYHYLTGRSAERSVPFPFDIHNRKSIAKANKEYLLYPNPVDDKLHVEFISDLLPKSVILYNVQGQTLEKYEVSAKKCSLDLSNYYSGIYFLQILFPDGKIVNEKIIIR